jgi:hypothetical protein
MSDLSNHQHQFSKMVPGLLNKCFELGFDVTILECKRTQVQADANAASGVGIVHSLHIQSLAIDLALFKDGVYLSEFKDYLPVGEYWESVGGSWGGRFKNVDADHFSLSFNGVR